MESLAILYRSGRSLTVFLLKSPHHPQYSAVHLLPTSPKPLDVPDLVAFTMRCGKRTIPETIDYLARKSPERTWARYATSSTTFERGELRTVSFLALARAIDTLAWYLHDHVATKLGSGSNVALYIGPSDFRYFILACAACKCNLKVSTMICQSLENVPS